MTFERDGLVWTISPDDTTIGFHLFTDGGFQTAEIRALLTWMQGRHLLREDHNVVLDVGANIGSTCIPLARWSGCRVLAIEPVAENFRLLQANVEANSLQERIRLVRKAVLREPAKVRMRHVQWNSGGCFVHRGDSASIAADAGATYEEVEAAPLDAIVEGSGLSIDEVALVWADVQGCEAEVIDSGSRLWKNGVPLWAEVEPHSLKLQGSLESFVDLAASHFDRFIESRDLLRLGNQAQPAPIRDLQSVIHRLTPNHETTDVLLLPRS
ncbi:MAG TPA: FkbM family methyltransferase [Candidatus Acidoferrales bacterium]|nr:FkbM family methyltransferase [Candidatus Acidoferrales bacterium]